MVYHFQTLDESTFVINTESMRWGRASSILSAPSIQAAEQNLAKFEFSEEGQLIPQGAGTYSLDGRTEKTTGPGAGLFAVTILSIPFIDTLVIELKANVPLKDGTFKSNPIKDVKYFIAQDRPKEEPAAAVAQE